MFNSGKIAVAGIALFLTVAAAQAHAEEEFILGAWARSQAECVRPELTFGKTRLDIALDADGQPSSFAYPDIRYQLGEQQIAVSLGSRHPYSKTPDKKALLFKRIDHDTIALQKKKGGDTRFIRCASV
jgi:hypothetical protein